MSSNTASVLLHKINKRPKGDTSDDEHSDCMEEDKPSSYGFSELISIIESTDIVSEINEITMIFSTIIAEMLMKAAFIDIDYKSMILNISKEKAYSRSYGIENLFKDDRSVYCSSVNSGNCVDLLLDLKREYTFTEFHARTPLYGYTCPLYYAYFWVFGSKTAKSEYHIKTLCQEQLYAKQKFEPLSIKFDVIDPETNERKRDEMVPVSFIDLSKTENGGLYQTEIASHIKGRYVLIKMIAGGHDKSNVDAKYVGLKGYKM